MTKIQLYAKATNKITLYYYLYQLLLLPAIFLFHITKVVRVYGLEMIGFIFICDITICALVFVNWFLLVRCDGLCFWCHTSMQLFYCYTQGGIIISRIINEPRYEEFISTTTNKLFTIDPQYEFNIILRLYRSHTTALLAMTVAMFFALMFFLLNYKLFFKSEMFFEKLYNERIDSSFHV